MPPAPQGNQSDNSAGIIWGVAALFAALGGIWYAFKSYLVVFYLNIKLYEVHLLSMFSSDYFIPLRNRILAALVTPETIQFPALVSIGEAVGQALRIPFFILLAILAVVVYWGNTTREYKRTYSLFDLAKLEQVNWPQIMPVIGLNLIKADIDKGPWAMAMTPMQFCKRHKLLEEIRSGQRKEAGGHKKTFEKVEVVLKKGDVNRLFALQLGPLWKGTQKLPPHLKALFAVFAARANADSKPAAEMIKQLNISSTSKLNFAGVDELCAKHENTPIVKEIVNRHAYVSTVMAAMLEAARSDGVQASSDFLWLKPLDRRMWYMLNTVGRQTPFVEVAGIFAHWVAEKTAQKKLLVPMVEEATKALELALQDVVYRPDPA